MQAHTHAYNVHSHTIRHIELIQRNGRKSTMDMRLFYNLRTKKNIFPLILCVSVSFCRWEKIASTQMVLHSNFKNSFTISYLCFSTSLFYCVSICFPFTYYVIFCVYQCSMCLANVICYPLPLYLLHSFFCLVLVVFLVQCGDFCISRICVSLFFFCMVKYGCFVSSLH